MKDVLLISTATFGIQAFVTLFVIMDPPGATPIFLALVIFSSNYYLCDIWKIHP
jgi:hypothetical protein